MPMIDNEQALRNMTARRATTPGRLLRSMQGGLGAMVGRTSGIAPLPNNSTNTQVPGVQPPRNRASADGMQARGPGMSGPAPRLQGTGTGQLQPPQRPSAPPTMGSGEGTAVRVQGQASSAAEADAQRTNSYGMISDFASGQSVPGPNAQGLYTPQPTQWSGAGATFAPAAQSAEGSLLEALKQAQSAGVSGRQRMPERSAVGTVTAAGPREIPGGQSPVQGGERPAPGPTQSQRSVGDPEGQDSVAAQEAERRRLEEEYRRQQAQQDQPRQEGDYTDQNAADASSYANQQGAAQQQQQAQQETAAAGEWVQREDGQWVNSITGLTQAEQVSRDRAAAARAEGYGVDDGSAPPLTDDPLNPGGRGRYVDGVFQAAPGWVKETPTPVSDRNRAIAERAGGMPDMGEAPQIDQAKINAMIAANAQERAKAESRTLQAALSRAARAGMSPEASTAMTGESQHRSAIAGAQDDARVRSDAEIQNFQANVQYFRDKQKVAADYAQMLAQIGASKEMQDRAIQASAYAAREAANAQQRLMAYQNELDNRLNPNSLLGASLGGLTSMGSAAAYGG